MTKGSTKPKAALVVMPRRNQQPELPLLNRLCLVRARLAESIAGIDRCIAKEARLQKPPK